MCHVSWKWLIHVCDLTSIHTWTLLAWLSDLTLWRCRLSVYCLPGLWWRKSWVRPGLTSINLHRYAPINRRHLFSWNRRKHITTLQVTSSAAMLPAASTSLILAIIHTVSCPQLFHVRAHRHTHSTFTPKRSTWWNANGFHSQAGVYGPTTNHSRPSSGLADEVFWRQIKGYDMGEETVRDSMQLPAILRDYSWQSRRPWRQLKEMGKERNICYEKLKKGKNVQIEVN